MRPASAAHGTWLSPAVDLGREGHLIVRYATVTAIGFLRPISLAVTPLSAVGGKRQPEGAAPVLLATFAVWRASDQVIAGRRFCLTMYPVFAGCGLVAGLQSAGMASPRLGNICLAVLARFAPGEPQPPASTSSVTAS